MSHSDNHPEHFDRPLRLTPEQLEKPLAVLRNFFQNAHLSETRETLWKLVETVLSIKINSGYIAENIPGDNITGAAISGRWLK